MKNLFDEELKKCFSDCLNFVLKNMQNPHANIKFIFNTYDDIKFQPVLVKIIFNDFYFKNVCLSSVSKRFQISIIVDNIHFDHFALVDKKFTIGKSECHGHGEFYGTDSFTFKFMRFKD